MPITLWSTEKMYLRQKGSSWCPWPSCACPWPLPPLCCWTLIESSPESERGLLLLFGRGGRGSFLRRRRVLRLPLGELLGRIDQHVRSHAVVAEAAELGAGELEVAGLGGLEPDGDQLAPDGVLLHAEHPDVEAVDHVLAGDVDDHRPVDGDVQVVDRGQVVLARGVLGVEAERVVA